MNIVRCEEEMSILVDQLVEERLIPVFGSGFTKGAEAHRGQVPDGDKANQMMKDIILKCTDFVSARELENKQFNDTSKLFNQLNRQGILKGRYQEFFRDYFTDVKLGRVAVEFLAIAWPYALTINVDDGIEKSGVFSPILPYLNARNDEKRRRVVYKLHGDASFECNYSKEDNIVFDVDQYTRCLNEETNKTMLECVSNSFREYNLLFIGCSLINEPDLKFLYNRVKGDDSNTSRYVIRSEAPNQLEMLNLQEYGITDVILVDDYETFYLNFTAAYRDKKVQEKLHGYPFRNPEVKVEEDQSFLYFGGLRCFDEGMNCFHKSRLWIERDCIEEINEDLKHSDLILLVGRRFSGKTAVLCELCARERRKNVYFFPSTSLESPDVVQAIINDEENALLIFDSNALPSEGYFLIRDSGDILKKNRNKVIMAVNQSDNYISEMIDCQEVQVRNLFSDKERGLLRGKTDSLGFGEKKEKHTNLDYLDYLQREQKINILKGLRLPESYTPKEQILLLLLCVKDKIFTKDIYFLGINTTDIGLFLDRTQILVEQVRVSKGESSSRSTYKLVHNSKIILLKQVQGFKLQETFEAIMHIIQSFAQGDHEQKRIYKDVMQFDTLNQLFGKKSGAGRLIFQVYEGLQEILKDDFHYWLQRAKSIYRLVPDNKYYKLKEAYGYAKKVYLDSKQLNLTAKAALTTSLICCLLYDLERDPIEKCELQREAISLGAEAMRSDYYRVRARLDNDAELNRKGYDSRIIEICNSYIKEACGDRDLVCSAMDILHKLSEGRQRHV